MTRKENTERPCHTIKLGLVEAAVWRNETDGRVWFNYTVKRSYPKEVDGKTTWRSTDSFGVRDALLASKVHDLVHTWICGHADANAVESDEP